MVKSCKNPQKMTEWLMTEVEAFENVKMLHWPTLACIEVCIINGPTAPHTGNDFRQCN